MGYGLIIHPPTSLGWRPLQIGAGGQRSRVDCLYLSNVGDTKNTWWVGSGLIWVRCFCCFLMTFWWRFGMKCWCRNGFSRLQICPLYIFGNYPPQIVPTAWSKYWWNQGFGGLIQGQIYNPGLGMGCWWVWVSYDLLMEVLAWDDFFGQEQFVKEGNRWPGTLLRIGCQYSKSPRETINSLLGIVTSVPEIPAIQR